jgi:transposase
MASKFSNFEKDVNLLLEAETSISTISTTLNKSKYSIYNAIKRIKKKKKEIHLERVSKGRVEKLSTREKRVINRDLTRSPKKVNKRLLVENNLSINNRTLQRFLKKEGYVTNKSSKKPYLNKEKARKRLLYCKEQAKDIKNINFNKVIFSDESAIERGQGARAEYYRTRGSRKKSKQIVSSSSTSTFCSLFFLLKYSLKGLFFF